RPCALAVRDPARPPPRAGPRAPPPARPRPAATAARAARNDRSSGTALRQDGTCTGTCSRSEAGERGELRDEVFLLVDRVAVVLHPRVRGERERLHTHTQL